MSAGLDSAPDGNARATERLLRLVVNGRPVAVAA